MTETQRLFDLVLEFERQVDAGTQQLFERVLAVEREIERDTERIAAQSHTIREIARYLSETGVSISRFTTTTQETLVAVALNGHY